MRNALLAFLQAFARLDADRIARNFLTMGFIDSSVDINRFRHDLNRIIHRYHRVVLADLSAESLFEDLSQVMRDHSVAFPSELALTLKVIVTVEGIGRELDPEFDIVEAARPFVAQHLGARFNIAKGLEGTAELLFDLWQAGKNLPFDLAVITRKLRSDDLRIKFDHQHLEGPAGRIERSLNRLAFAIVTAGLLVGSSLVTQLQVGPRLLGIPVIGLLGYGASGILALWLLISIIRSRKM
jgi:ubiquinone biosynthesis protein